MKKYAIICLIFFGCLISTSCDKQLEDIKPLELSFLGYAVEGKTNGSGEIAINTKFNQTAAKYILKLQNENQQPVEGMNVVYFEHNDKSVFFFKDDQGVYQSSFLYGTKEELERKYGTHSGSNARMGETQREEGVVLTTISLLVTIGTIAYSEIKIAYKAYKINKFAITDIVEEGDDYKVYCKDFNQLAELISARTGIKLEVSSIVISFIMGSSKPTLVNFVFGVGLSGTQEIRNALLEQAIEVWGLTADELINRPIAVKMFFHDQTESFSNVKNLFAFYEIDINNVRCAKYIADVPEEVNDFINVDVLNVLQEKGLTIHKGIYPPDMTGSYLGNSLTNYETGNKYINYIYKFLNQTASNEVEVIVNSVSGDIVDIGSGIGSFISGNNKGFSIYSEVNQTVTEGDHKVYIKSANIYSGLKNSTGISDFQNGFIILEKQNDIYNNYMNVGEVRIIFESDNFLEKVADVNSGRKSEEKALVKRASVFSNE
jgi:hypothetical protein